MAEPGARLVSAVTRLRAAIEHTAGALARPHLDALLDGEERIALALADMPPASTLSADERQIVRAEIEGAGRALMRCRRLGASLGDFVRISLEAQGHRPEYGPRPGATMPYAGQALDTRV